ncbi:OmpA family protein [Pseudozobellia thermophila]|nr:OmpA family protein [Pseudozobellia thermophila]
MTNLLGIVITILAGIYFYITCCSSCGIGVAEEPAKLVMVQPEEPEITSYPFSVGDGTFSYETEDNFNFNTSSSEFLKPLSPQVQEGIVSELKGYLTENANKVVNITGYYKEGETNNTAFPNLGLARANAVKNHFVAHEIPSSQINIIGEAKNEMVPDNEVLMGPVAFQLQEVAANAEEELKALYDKIKADPLILYFDTAEASINLSAAQRQKVAEIARYLDKVPDAQAEIIGYTDSEGKASTNLRLGQERADFAKAYLVQNGISADRIGTDSKGKQDPIASNATEEGRAKNRRTVISIK